MRRLRGALVALLVAAVGVAAWIVTTSGVRRADEPSVKEHRAEMTGQARLAAAIVGRWLTDARAQLGGVKASLQREPVSRAALDRLTGGNFDGGLLVIDQRRVAVATSSALAKLEGRQRDNPAITASLQGHDASGDVFEDASTHLLYVPMTTPLSATTALVGLTTLKHSALARAVADAQTALGHPLKVVTAGGTIVGPAVDRVDDEIAPAVAAAPKGPGTLTYRGEGKTETVASFAPLPEGWSVVMPRPAASLAVTGDRATAAAGAALAVVLAIACAVVLALYALLRRRTANVEESKKAFLAIAGHELRTPLTVMKGYTELLVERWDDVDDDTRQGIVETVSVQVRNLEHLVERLLLGAQLEAGVTPSTMQDTVVLGALVDEVAQHQRGVAPTHSFVVDVPEGLSVKGDATALTHVMTNLVENAVKYSPDGGTVTMRAEPAERDRVRLTVDDEGIGLPANTEIIFEKFVQREAVDRRVHDEGGVGLGLYIARTLVERMGGTVRAQRRHPKGSSFVVTLRRA